MVITDRDKQPDTQAFERTERRIELCAFEVRRQDRQWSAFFDEQHRVRVVNTSGNDSSSTAVFHGAKVETVRERMLREHREEVEQEQRYRERRRALAVRRRTGVLHFCRHCNTEMFRGLSGDKCQRCKDDPALITARGTETRSFVPRREAQPDVTPLSLQAELVLALIAELDAWMREPLELRYFEKMTDTLAAQRMRVPVKVFAGYARAGVLRVSDLLANPIITP
jgi:hypothetical protein